MSDTEKVQESPKIDEKPASKITGRNGRRPKREMTEEQLERLAKMRAIAFANREKRKAERDKEKQEKQQALEKQKEIKKMEEEANIIESGLRVKSKLKQLKEKKALEKQESSDEEPVVKKKSKKKKKISIVADSSSDSETEIVIRKPRRKTKQVIEKEPMNLLPPQNFNELQTSLPENSAKSIDELVEEKLSARFSEYRKQAQEDETINLIRQLIPNYKR